MLILGIVLTRRYIYDLRDFFHMDAYIIRQPIKSINNQYWFITDPQSPIFKSLNVTNPGKSNTGSIDPRTRSKTHCGKFRFWHTIKSMASIGELGNNVPRCSFRRDCQASTIAEQRVFQLRSSKTKFQKRVGITTRIFLSLLSGGDDYPLRRYWLSTNRPWQVVKPKSTNKLELTVRMYLSSLGDGKSHWSFG